MEEVSVLFPDIQVLVLLCSCNNFKFFCTLFPVMFLNSVVTDVMLSMSIYRQVTLPYHCQPLSAYLSVNLFLYSDIFIHSLLTYFSSMRLLLEKAQGLCSLIPVAKVSFEFGWAVSGVLFTTRPDLEVWRYRFNFLSRQWGENCSDCGWGWFNDLAWRHHENCLHRMVSFICMAPSYFVQQAVAAGSARAVTIKWVQATEYDRALVSACSAGYSALADSWSRRYVLPYLKLPK